MWVHRQIARWTTALLLLSVLALFTGAAAPDELSAEELIRQANDAFLRGDGKQAARLYDAAELLTSDPGLVSFNRAAILFQSGAYREAELLYARVLDDAACPPERAARAWYNRGTCLIRREGAGASVYRSAIACLERCLDSSAADEPLKADARHNLELAKLLWDDARKKEHKEANPNKDVPQEDPRHDPPPPKSYGNDPQFGGPETGDSHQTGAQTPKVIPQHVAGVESKAKGSHNQAPAPGSLGQVQPLEDRRNIQPLSPEETREHLRRIAVRLKSDQQMLRATLYGPERPGLHDW